MPALHSFINVLTKYFKYPFHQWQHITHEIGGHSSTFSKHVQQFLKEIS